ncbi:MAG: SIS domain-containing protein, partial [Jiangellaceae bacterium]
AIAGDDGQVVPLLERAPEPDIFADPFDEGVSLSRPSLLVLDDGADSAGIRLERERVLGAAERAAVRVHEVREAEGPDVGKFAALLATGRFAAAYLALGLGRPAA